METFVRDALEALPRNPDLIRLKVTLVDAQATEAWRRKNYDEAIGLYDAAEKELKVYTLYLGKATVARAAKRYDEGLESIDRALALAPETGRAHYVRGRLYVGKGELTKGIEALSGAVALSPWKADYRRELGQALEKGAQFQKAYEELEVAAKDAPDADTCKRMAKILLFDLHRSNDGVLAAQKAVELGPGDRWNWYYLSVAHYQTHDAHVVESLSRFLEMAKKDPSGMKREIDWAEKVLPFVRDAIRRD